MNLTEVNQVSGDVYVQIQQTNKAYKSTLIFMTRFMRPHHGGFSHRLQCNVIP